MGFRNSPRRISPGVTGSSFLTMKFTSVIIDDLHVVCTCVHPPKTDAPLIIDTNTVLAGTLALEGFKAIARRHLQVL
jgi:hypothetical protein